MIGRTSMPEKRIITTGGNGPPTDTDCRRKLPKGADAQIVEAVKSGERTVQVAADWGIGERRVARGLHEPPPPAPERAAAGTCGGEDG